ncbi:MAG TPA: cytochrome c maturation protein CcmE [Acetobacteraceae bacterium]|nr:cytochrome c maturation protein CcmE [Acetobacteraceae bacterium]
MTRKRRRLYLLLACGVGLGSAAALALSAFSQDMVFFVDPTQLLARTPSEQTLRLGGMVQAGSVQHLVVDGHPVEHFRVTDGHNSIAVSYTGILPDLFREGQGVVTIGTLQPDGSFLASEVLAKHDATYMPKDVAEALKKSGRWNPAYGPPPPASTWDTMTVRARGT